MTYDVTWEEATKARAKKEAESIKLGRCCAHVRQRESKHMIAHVYCNEAYLPDDSILLLDTGPHTDTPLSCRSMYVGQ